MKIVEQVKELTVVGDIGNTRKATISADKMAKLQYLLTKGLYRDPITAVIAEWTNNGVDGVVQSGKDPIENPVMVTIGSNKQGQSVFSVEDKGTGLDDREFEDICMNYLESTKENDNNAIGHFGIGMKSFLSLERPATFTCRKNGKERVYLVYEGEEFVNYDLITEKDTEEEDGVKAELVINTWERGQFISKARQKLAYYDTVVLVIDGVPEVWEIHRNDLFQRSSANKNNQMHLCLKDVYYSIDWEALGIKPLNYPIALRFGLDSGIIPTPSRESYITNEKTKKLILDRIAEVADWFVTKYNETVKEFATFREAYPYLGKTTPTLYLPMSSGGQVSYDIEQLSYYSSHNILKPKVKGIVLKDPADYKIRKDDLFFEWIPVGYLNPHGVYRGTKNMGASMAGQFFSGKNPVIVADGMKGNMREYLKEKYGRDTLFIRCNPDKRKLGSDKNTHGWTSYTYVLDLHLKNKKRWREFIKEWEFVRDQISSNFVDERGVENTQPFLDWVEKRKELLRSKRKGGKYSGLNKQAGDVTLGYLTPNKRGAGWKKGAFPIVNLPFNQYLTVLVDDDNDKEKEQAKVIAKMIGRDTIKFATVGKKESKKVPNCSQFINFQKFMTRDCKPFMRLASAIAFDRALTEFYKISRYKNGIFQNCLAPLLKDSETLQGYVDKNLKDTGDDTVANEIISVADQYNLYDLEMWDVYKRVKEGTKKYDFISCLQEPRVWNTEENERYDRTINQLLLFRKKYYDDLPEGARIVFDEITV